MTSLARPLRFAAAAIACALALTACGSSAHKATVPPPRTHSLVSIFEAQAELMSDPGRTLALLRRLGVDVVRVFVQWGRVAPGAAATVPPAGDLSSPAAYDATLAQLDAIDRAAMAHGIAVDLMLTGPAPAWAAGSGVPTGGDAGVWRPSSAKFGDFVSALGRRYGGAYTPAGAAAALPRVHFWSIWNEPNYGYDLAPQAVSHSRVEVSPALYRGLLNAAWRALHVTGHGSDTILIGELAPRGITVGDNPGNFSGMVPLRFLRALYCLDGSLRPLQAASARERQCPSGSGGREAFVRANPALFGASGFAVHPYPFGALAPNLTTPAAPGESDWADLATLGRFEHTLDRVLAAYGSQKRFWIYDTEFGYKTNPPYAGGAPPATASDYLNWAEYLHWRDPRVRSYDQYLLGDPAANSNFDTGLEFADGRRKPLFAAFRLPIYLPVTTARHGDTLEVWGCVRAADEARAQTGVTQQAVVEFAPAGSRHFSVLRRVAIDDPNGYIDVAVAPPGSGVVRLAWADPSGRAVHSRNVVVTIS